MSYKENVEGKRKQDLQKRIQLAIQEAEDGQVLCNCSYYVHNHTSQAVIVDKDTIFMMFVTSSIVVAW